MKRFLLVFLFVAICQAAPSWLGSWVIRATSTNSPDLCPVASQYTNAKISTINGTHLNLAAVLNGTNNTHNWDLPWTASANISNHCSSSWCITSILIGDNATINWAGVGIYIGVRCTITLSRPAWLGQWYVTSTYSNDTYYCWAPKLYTDAWNSRRDTGHLQTWAIGMGTNYNSTEVLHWSPFDRNASTTFNWCNQTGYMTTDNGNITAFVQITCTTRNLCQSGWTITKFPEIPVTATHLEAVAEEPVDHSFLESSYDDYYYYY